MKLSDGEWSIASCPSSDVPSRLRNRDKLVSLIPARSQKASTAKPLNRCPQIRTEPATTRRCYAASSGFLYSSPSPLSHLVSR
jgi:hypothetical protein